MFSLVSGLVIGTIGGFLLAACLSSGARKEAETAAYRRGIQAGYAAAQDVATHRAQAAEQDNTRTVCHRSERRMTRLDFLFTGLVLGLFVACCVQTHRLTKLQHDFEADRSWHQGAQR